MPYVIYGARYVPIKWLINQVFISPINWNTEMKGVIILNFFFFFACSELQEVLAQIQGSASSEQQTKNKERQTLRKKIEFTEKELDDITALMKEKIGSMVEDVERKVCSEFLLYI